VTSIVAAAAAPAAQRLRCVPGMFNRLEVQVLYPVLVQTL
jgi:hypothetical protein